jgi:UDP-glucose 4-epimerase
MTSTNKILVTGGNGFIGHTLVRDLLEKDIEVKVVDIKPIKFEHKNLTFIKKSVLDNLKAEMQDCDVIYHLAAELGVINSDLHPLNTLKVNIDGTVNVFKCALDAGTKRIIYSSSSEVYGEPRESPINEDCPKSPVSIYGVSKLTAEMYAHGYTKEHGLNINPVRFFNVYGPGQGFDWVMPIFIKQVIEGKDPTVFGDGSMIRCFTYITDIINGMETIRAKCKTGQAYNIANTEPTTMKELAEKIIKTAGKELNPKILGFGKQTRERSREIMKRIPDISRLKSLGWEPKISTDEGIKKAYEWYKNNMGKEELFYE